MVGWMGALALIVGGLGCGGNDGLSPGGQGGSDGGAGAGGGNGGAGAGGSNVGVTCGAVQPCGGSIAGTWKVASACFAKDASLDASGICATASIQLTTISAVGSTSYGADGTYQTTGTIKIGLQLTVPASCFATGETCADIDMGFAQEQQDMTITSHSCAMSGSSCVCTIESQQGDESGTYSTSGTTLTTTATGGQPSDDSYCVQGNMLHDLAVDMSMQTSMGMVTIQGDITSTRQ